MPNTNSLDFKNSHVLYALDVPEASLIKRLEMSVTTFGEDHGHFDEQPTAAEPDQINSTSAGGQIGSSNQMGSSLVGSTYQQVGTQQIGGTSSSNLGGSSGIGPSTAASGSTSRAPLYEALWICAQEFKKVEKQSFSKRLFVFTDSDMPGSGNDLNLALQRAKDLASLNVDIELFALPHFNQMRPMFDIRRFYANIITFDEDEFANGLLDVEEAQTRLFELMRRIRQKEFKKRIQGKCLFEIAGGASVAMSFFTTLMPAKKPSAVKVRACDHKPLKTTTRLVCKESGQSLY